MAIVRIKDESGTWVTLDGMLYTPGAGIIIDEYNNIKLDMDRTPTAYSVKPVTSDGIKNYVDNAIQQAGAGDMTRAVYDTNHSGVVDNAEKVNGHTVGTDVPYNAKFTDTTYLFNTAYNAQTNRAASMADIPTNISAFNNDAGYITSGYVEQEPAFNGSAAKNITTQDINNWNDKQDPIVFNTAYHASNNKAATMADVPTDLSDLTNDAGYITGYTESDPIFTTSPAYGITQVDINAWNNKQDVITFNTLYNATTNKAATMKDIPVNVSVFNNDAGYITSADIPAEQEPAFNGSAAKTITSSDITYWNNKQNALVFKSPYDATLNKVATENDIPTVPSDLGDLTNNAGYIKGYTETDPIFNASPAKTITYNDINNWNSKMDSLVFNTAYNAVTNKAATMADVNTKQDILVFNTTYNASTNKAATMSDVNTKQDPIVFNTAYDATSNKAATMADITGQEIVFNTTYDASTNKAATMADINDAIYGALRGAY